MPPTIVAHAGVPEWPKGKDSRSFSSGFRGFESLPPHQITGNAYVGLHQITSWLITYGSWVVA